MYVTADQRIRTSDTLPCAIVSSAHRRVFRLGAVAPLADIAARTEWNKDICGVGQREESSAPHCEVETPLHPVARRGVEPQQREVSPEQVTLSW